jgi:hypothetical protein
MRLIAFTLSSPVEINAILRRDGVPVGDDSDDALLFLLDRISHQSSTHIVLH